MTRLLALTAFYFCFVFKAVAGDATPQQVDFFESKIRPVLVEHCYACHSAQSKKLKAGLRLDHHEGLTQGGDSGPAVTPGSPERSLLNKAIGYNDSSIAMPPKAKLNERVIADFEQWVKMGLPWPKQAEPLVVAKQEWNWPELRQSHWSFRPMQHPAVPTVKNKAWPRSDMDRFILAKLEQAGIEPSSAADRQTLLRRASYDLTGLPPTMEESDAFVNDPSPDAFANVVERLLASPRYGERWGRYWLDVARYSDGLGGFLDGSELKGDAWRYRDWVVQAINRDLPFDHFVKAQLAGDVLYPDDDAIATGFLALGPTYQSDGGTEEGKAIAQSETLDDRVDTVARGLLGLTIACARCHDHKFDPIPQQDYYSLAGVFHNTSNIDQALPGTPKEVIDRYTAANKAVTDLEKELNLKKKKPGKSAKPNDEDAEITQKKAQLVVLKKNVPEKYPTMHVVKESGHADMAVALRGNLLKPGEIAPRRFLKIVAGQSPAPFRNGSGRVELAEAIMHPENPLTARVMVNRVWMQHFGRALVRTPDNFGKLGDKPTHPELLDWLARSFIDSGWSLKQLHRTIMLSAAYQMTSRINVRSFAQDGDNRLIWRMEPRRLDVEAWRDGLLAVTKSLDETVGGPATQSLLDGNRRTLYSVISRNGDKFQSDDFLRLFDFPSARATSAKRHTSIVPQQFLFMMNSSFMEKRAKALAARLNEEAQGSRSRIELAYRLLFDRAPTSDETRAASAFLQQAPLEQYAQVLLSSNEFLFLR